MARRKPIDINLLQGLVKEAESQEVQKGTPRSIDPNFPVFSTPINQDILVYIPRTNVVADENGETMKMLSAYMHEAKLGRQFMNLRCISGLNVAELGYDGTCPACEATREAWDLYNIKLEAEAKRLGVDPQNDPNNTLKPTRETILKEMAIKGSEEYVTFPIVIIPTSGNKTPAPDALEKLEVVFVHWRKKRYEDSILTALDALMTNPGHPAGLFWHWKFSYNTEGKPATAMLSAKNAKYNIIQDPNAVQAWKPIAEAAEVKAKDFTLVKAAEVVVANQFLYKEDLEADVNKIIAHTRQLIEMSKQGGAQALPVGQGQAGVAGENPLATFGQAQGQPQQANFGQAQPQANFGQAQPQANFGQADPNAQQANTGQAQAQGQPQANFAGFGQQ